MNNVSALEKERLKFQPQLPSIFQGNTTNFTVVEKDILTPAKDESDIKAIFPSTFGKPVVGFRPGASEETSPFNTGVIFSGGQASGGHNVIAGLFDGLKAFNAENRLFGFLNGPEGLVSNSQKELTTENIAPFRNTGGFDMIGSGRTKLTSTDQFRTVQENCEKLNVSAIVIIGGDDSNTTAGVMAEYFAANGVAIQVVGCPKTIDGDLRNQWIETSFGFDTACKVYSALIGNIERDAMSAKKYWHIVKLMGRSASHIALECALQTHPNVAVISEEVEANESTLREIVDGICTVIVARSKEQGDYGIALLPEGLIEFIPEIKRLISELNDLLANSDGMQENIAQATEVAQLKECGLSENSANAYLSLPASIRNQLILDRDPHGNVQVSKIDTEKLLIEKISERLGELKKDGVYNGKFSAQGHFFGYEGRCIAPSNFDANYTYGLGYTAAALLDTGVTGYLSSVQNLTSPVGDWVPAGIPLTGMMNIERRHGSDKPVIQKYLVDLNGKPFKTLEKNRDEWAAHDNYTFPGPIQYFGPSEITDCTTKTLAMEQA